MAKIRETHDCVKSRSEKKSQRAELAAAAPPPFVFQRKPDGSNRRGSPDNPHYPYPEELWERIKDLPITDEEMVFMALFRAREGFADEWDFERLERLLPKGSKTWREVQRLKREKPPRRKYRPLEV